MLKKFWTISGLKLFSYNDGVNPVQGRRATQGRQLQSKRPNMGI